MSLSIKIHVNSEINRDELISFLDLKINDLKLIQKTEDLFYFYVAEKSLRGVDFEKQKNTYEILRLSMFSEADELICRQIFLFAQQTQEDCKFYLDDEPITFDDLMNLPLVDFKDDLRSIQLLASQLGKTISFYGPLEKFHFGPKVFSKIDTEKEGWENHLVDIAYRVLYELKDPSGDYVLSAGEGENMKLVKMINSETSYVIRKFDYLIFLTENETEDEREIIAVTNEDLNNFLPDSWELADEYTIVAPALSPVEYRQLVKKLIPFDQSNELAEKD